MNLLNYYEIMGVAVPGAALLIGLAFFTKPEWTDLVFSKDFGIANLSVFLVVAYVAGQFIQAFGNVLEKIYWFFGGDMPTFWVLASSKKRLLFDDQVHRLGTKIESKLNLKDIAQTLGPYDKDAPAVDGEYWFSVISEIYGYVKKNGDVYRIDRFNANYGLNRGMAAAAIVIASAIVVLGCDSWIRFFLFLLGVTLIFLYRMQRFGKTYAQELFSQFLLAVEKKETAEKKEAEK